MAKVFLAVHGVERDHPSGEIEFGKQRLGGRDFVGFIVDLDVRDGERGLNGKSAEDLFGSTVVETIKASAQDFTVDRQNPALTRRTGRRSAQICSMGSERRLDIGRIKTAQNRADRGVRRWFLPPKPERSVEPLQMDLDEGMDAPIGVGPGDDRQDRKQQDVPLLEALALGTPWIGNRLEPPEDGIKCFHRGNFVSVSTAAHRFRRLGAREPLILLPSPHLRQLWHRGLTSKSDSQRQPSCLLQKN